MNTLFDSHCHIQVIGQTNSDSLTVKKWATSGLTLQDVIDNAKKASVTELMVVGCDLEESKQAIELARLHPKIYASIGIHPHEADRYINQPDKLKEFAKLATDPSVKAIGECGLDYFYNHSTPENQKIILEFQIKLALENNLPLIFHVREAYEDFWPLFNKLKPTNGVLHSYTDSQQNLDIALKNGLFIGVNGIVTFSKDAQQLEMYKNIPLSSMVLETDAPYLTPGAIRGNINEPRNVVLVAEFLANLRGENLDKIASETTKNSRTLFRV
jgi:TatD DNase family protein